MNQLRKWATTLSWGFILIGLWTPGLSAQTSPSRDTLLGAAREVVEAARHCGLVTYGEAGEARVRTMDPFLPDDDWSIWMGTHRESRKVREIQANPRVTLYYYSPEHAGYVTVYGTADLVDDRTEKASRWKDEWEAFYTDRDTQYLLIRVIPERLEVINYSRAIGGDAETWEPPSIEFGGG